MKQPGLITAGCIAILFSLMVIGCQSGEPMSTPTSTPPNQTYRSQNFEQHAENLRAQGRYPEARQHVMEALQIDPSNQSARRLLQRIDREAGMD